MLVHSPVTSVKVSHCFFLAAPRCLNSSHPQLCQESGELVDQCHDEHPWGNGPHQGTLPLYKLTVGGTTCFLSRGASFFLDLQDQPLQNHTLVDCKLVYIHFYYLPDLWCRFCKKNKCGNIFRSIMKIIMSRKEPFLDDYFLWKQCFSQCKWTPSPGLLILTMLQGHVDKYHVLFYSWSAHARADHT